MSDDLISRKFLLECAEYDDKWRLVIPYEKVKNAPTAFDKEKVIEKIKEIMNDESIRFVDQAVNRTIEIIEIVEKGGIE